MGIPISPTSAIARMIRLPSSTGTCLRPVPANRWTTMAFACASLPTIAEADSTAYGPSSAGPWWFAVLALIALAGLCTLLWRRSRRLKRELQAIRVQAQGLADLLDVWQWRSDVLHHLTHVQPPHGAAASAWSAAAKGGAVW